MIDKFKKQIQNNKSVKNILLLKNEEFIVEKDYNYNIFLSNEYYWRIYKKIDNISLKQAKKMAYSIFFKFIPNIENMEFLVFEIIKNEFLFIAYNKKEIIDILIKKGFNFEKIKQISLIQFLNIENNEIFRINENYIIESKDNLISLIKNNELNIENLDIENLVSLNYFNLKLFNNTNEIDNNKYNISFFIINILLIIFTSFSIYNNIKINKNIVKYNDFLLSQNNLPNSMIQLNSIYIKYKSLEDKKNNINSIFEILSTLNLLNFDIEIVDNNFNIIVLNNKDELLNKIIIEFNKKNISNYKIENNILKVEI